VIRDDIADIAASTPRKRFLPLPKTIPKSQQDVPVVYGVRPSYRTLQVFMCPEGGSFDEDDESQARPVCVLGAGAMSNLFGSSKAIDQYVQG